MRRLYTFLKIQPAEISVVGLIAVLFAAVEAGKGFGANSADALFFTRFGVGSLPFMYLGLGVATFLATTGYTIGYSRITIRHFYRSIPIIMAAVLAVERFVIAFDPPFIYPVLWLTINIFYVLIGLLSWNIATQVCNTRQAKRLFPIFTSAGILGSVLGNLTTSLIVEIINAANLLIIYIILLLIITLLIWRTTNDHFPDNANSTGPASIIADISTGFNTVRRLPLLRLMAIISILLSILFFSISFPFSKEVTQSLGDEEAIARFLGIFSSITTFITFLVSLFIANRVYARLGIVNAFLIVPLVYVVGFFSWIFSFNLISASIVRMAQLVFMGGIGGSAFSALYNVVPGDCRSQVQSFMSGGPRQFGIVLSGLLLIAAERLFTPQQVFISGIVFGVVCLVLVIRMRANYTTALVDALEAGYFDLFSGNGSLSSTLQNDATTISTLRNALDHQNSSTRLFALHMIGQLDTPEIIPAVFDRLNDSDISVREKAIITLGNLNAFQASADLLTIAMHSSEVVLRRQALATLPGLQPQASPELLAFLDTCLADPDSQVRVYAAAAIAHYGQPQKAWDSLVDSCCSDIDPETRYQSIMGFQRIVANTGAALDTQPVQELIDDPTPRIRKAAIEALTFVGETASVNRVAARLEDPDEAVRRAAARYLFSVSAYDPLLKTLTDGRSEAQRVVLSVLTPDKFTGLIESYARRELDRLAQLKALDAALPRKGKVTQMLAKLLKERIDANQDLLLSAINLLEDTNVSQVLRQALHDQDSEQQAIALEVLDTTSHKPISKQFIATLEAADSGISTPADIIHWLLSQNDKWLKLLGAYAVSELDLTNFAFLTTIANTRIRIVQDIARATDIIEEEMKTMKTFQTLSTLERVLLLREVPLFAELSPDDLKGIAEVAEERLHSAGTIICREGDQGRELYIIVSGSVQVFREADNKQLALITKDDIVGEMSIIESEPRSATLKAETDTRLLVLDAKAFTAILRDRPTVMMALLKTLSRRLRAVLTEP